MDIRKELVEGITQELIKYLCEEKHMQIDEAMEVVYNSITFDKVSDIETGLYKESPSYVYELLKDEINEGTLIQKEQ